MASDPAAHYRVLGVDPSASTADIRRSYLRVARDTHPDFHNGSEAARIDAEERMRRVNAAWAVLGDVDSRREYDRRRPAGERRAPFHTASHGRIDDRDKWHPFDDGPVVGFDDRDDRPITSSALPSWLKTVPALGVLFGLAALILGLLISLEGMARVGLLVLAISALAFLAAPMVALSISRREDCVPGSGFRGRRGRP